jgi:hypothetical protein
MLFAPVNLKPYNAAKPLRRTRSNTQQNHNGDYSFLESAYGTSTSPSEPANISGLPDLDSIEVSYMVDEGFTLFPAERLSPHDENRQLKEDLVSQAAVDEIDLLPSLTFPRIEQNYIDLT